MSGVAAVQARIAQIQAEFSLPATTSFATVLSAQTAAVSRAHSTGGVAAPGSMAATAGPLATPLATSPAGAAPPGWAAKLPAQGQRWADEIQIAADEAGIDPRLLAALVRAESNFDASAGSHAGAIGLAQLMPATAAELGVDPHDPMANLRGGARYLAQQLDRFGTPELALAAYNAGPGRVMSAGGIPQITETQSYVVRVIDYYRELQ